MQQLFNKLKEYIKRQGLWWMLYIAFTWVIPLVLISEKYVFVDTGRHEVRPTAIGLMVGVVLLLFFRKFLWSKVLIMKPSTVKWGLLTFNRALPYAVLVALVYMVIQHTKTIQVLLWQIGVSLLLGALFELVYILQQKAIQEEQLDTTLATKIKNIQESSNNDNIG